MDATVASSEQRLFTDADVFESASRRHNTDGIDARASMVIYIYVFKLRLHNHLPAAGRFHPNFTHVAVAFHHRQSMRCCPD